MWRREGWQGKRRGEMLWRSGEREWPAPKAARITPKQGYTDVIVARSNTQ